MLQFLHALNLINVKYDACMICAHAEPSVRGHVMILRRKCARTRYGKLLDFLGESIALLLRWAQIDDARTHWIIALKISGTDHFLIQRIIKKKSAADRNSDIKYRFRDCHIG